MRYRDQSLVPLTPAPFFSALKYLFVESDPQATRTAFLSSPGMHCSALGDSERESGSCGVGLGSMFFLGRTGENHLEKPLNLF